MGLVLGLVSLYRRVGTFVPPDVYFKDLLQDYLLGKAVLDGVDPYVPMQELTGRYVGQVVQAVVAHPIPHPPPVGILFAPLALLDYPTAATIWLGLQIICIVASVYLLGRTAGVRLSALITLAIAASTLALPQFYEDLDYGQLMLVLLTLLVAARFALLSGRQMLGGTLVGLAVLVKLIPWPLVLLFLLRRDWRALAASAGTIVLGYAVAGWIIGPGTVGRYITGVAPVEAETYRAAMPNISVASLGWRLFEGTVSPGAGIYGVTAPPLVRSAPAALIVSVGLPALVLLAACLIVRRQRSLDVSLGVMICASILISPVSWAYYMLLASIPAAQVIGWLIRHRLPVRETNLALLVALPLLPSYREWAFLAFAIAGQAPVESGQSALPFGPALSTMVPAVGVGLLGWLSVKLVDQRASARADETHG